MYKYALHLSKLVLLLTLTLIGFAACHKDPEIPDPEPEVETPARTVLAYIIGDNSLSSYAAVNVDSMLVGLAKGDTANINLLVYQDSYSGSPTLYKLGFDAEGNGVRQTVRTFIEQNSVDKSIMSGIIRDAFDRYPADEKGLILWSHGTGWVPSVNYAPSKSRAFGQDYTEWLELWDVRDVLERSGVHFDYLIFDACYMANVEVAYELRNVTDYLIASVTEIMGIGFPYREIIALMAQPELDLIDVARAYSNYYDGRNDYYGGTISVIKTERLDDLAAHYRTIVAADTLTAEQVKAAKIQEFGRYVTSVTSYHTYFYDFAQTAATLGPWAEAQTQALLDDIVLYEAHTPTFGFTSGGGEKFSIRSCSGLSVFIPKVNHDATLISAYNRLAWTQATAGSYEF